MDKIRERLLAEVEKSEAPRETLKDKELKSLAEKIKDLPQEERAEFGRQVNVLKREISAAIEVREHALLTAPLPPLDLTAPTDINMPIPGDKPYGGRHPLMVEMEKVIEIYNRLGFGVIESRALDDDYHMFETLNFPDGHPARDGYDSFRTKEGLIPPAHTSNMQNRILKAHKKDLETLGYISYVVPGRVFRNEDVDATHEHTFYQCEGIFVSKKATLSNMLGVLKRFFELYYEQKLNIKTQPGYFPFTEPSLEFLIEKPKSLGGKKGDYLEMLGCGMIHPNVLKMAEIDPEEYKGFAWGGGIERLVMLKYGLKDIRDFESGRLRFLKHFR